MGNYLPLDEGYFAGCWIVDEAKVNLNDLVNMRPGRVVRARDMEAIKYIPPSMDDYERIAGLISDAA